MGKLIKNEIGDELRLIPNTYNYYITNNGKIYSLDYKGDLKQLSTRVNKRNGYVYVSKIKYIDKEDKNKNHSNRVHRLVALCYVDNPDPNNLLVVGHKDNNKQNNNYTNLYWTTNQDNTQKAVDDGLNDQPMGVDNDNSYPLKVVDLNNNLISVYGSMREACRLIENLELSYLGKMLRREGNDYKPRNKNYKYFKITKEEYNSCPDTIKGLKLIEKEKLNKKVRRFKAVNTLTGEEFISDNQKQFAKEHGLEQSNISHCLLGNCEQYNGWIFEILEELDYKNYSGYDNSIELFNNLKAINIETGEELIFSNPKALKDHFGLKGHDLAHYLYEGNLLFSKWKVEITD